MHKAGWRIRSAVFSMLAVTTLLRGETQHSDDAEKARQIEQAQARARRVESQPKLTAEQRELHLRADELIARLRQAPAGSYKLDRLAAAIKALHDASVRIELASNSTQAINTAVVKEDVKWNVDRAYFRTAQIGFFARRVTEMPTRSYVDLAERLYHMAASAYDAGNYYRADRLASASSTVVHCVEALAQAELKTGERPSKGALRE